jgi:hypothetical protein
MSSIGEVIDVVHEKQQSEAPREEGPGAAGHEPCGKTLVNLAYDGGEADGAVSPLMPSTWPIGTFAALVGRRAPCVGSSGTEGRTPRLLRVGGLGAACCAPYCMSSIGEVIEIDHGYQISHYDSRLPCHLLHLFAACEL